VTQQFLVVAASGQVREDLAEVLRARGQAVSLAASAAEAERVCKSARVETVLIESHLSDMSAQELRQSLLAIQPDCRIHVVTSLELARKNPGKLLTFDSCYVLDREPYVDLLCCDEAAPLDEQARRGHEALLQAMDVLVGLRELEERYFGGSSHQVMRLVRAVAEEALVPPDAIHEMVLATLLRDTGKVALPDELLAHKGALTAEHRERMADHVISSLQLFEHIDFPWKILPIIRHHHERYDGKGYPDGLRGREIPLGARVIAVVDAYVAMISHRAHRKALPAEQALAELVLQAGQQFDPEVVEMFQRVVDRFQRIRGVEKPSVLVVEPDEDFRRLLAMRLLNAGLDVIQLESNEQALTRLLEEPPDLVLADIDTDPNETFQMLRELHDDDILRRLPFVVLSRGTDRVLKLRALREGVDEFLAKSDDAEELVAHVENVLARERRREDEQGNLRRGITGSLEHLSLPDIVQTLVIGMKTASVSLHSDSGNGQLWFENGAPRHAIAGELEGESAFFEMLRWHGGEFVIEHGVRAKQRTLDQDATFLLMEGLRLIDEETIGSSAEAG
jgi:response regulator RpfG family c-di-GMP phosphodiesterase